MEVQVLSWAPEHTTGVGRLYALYYTYTLISYGEKQYEKKYSMDKYTRHSYGIIPLIGTPDTFEVLVIEQRDPFVPKYWTFAKGTPEGAETPRETAEREVYEEVGISFTAIDSEFRYTEVYSFIRADSTIEKSVTYFVGKAFSKDFVLQEKEVVSAKWCTPSEALTLLKFQGARDTLEKMLESGAPSRLLG